jgi:hypothetical protein
MASCVGPFPYIFVGALDRFWGALGNTKIDPRPTFFGHVLYINGLFSLDPKI